MSDDIVRVAAKLRAFRADYPPTVAGIVCWFTEDEVGGTARVIGHCRITDLATGNVMAEAHGTRALREPIPGAMGHKDTRDPDRAQTQATGRALGLLGYAQGESLEGDTDEPDETGVTVSARAQQTLTKTQAGHHVKAILRDKYHVHEDDLKAQGKACWSEQGMDGRQGWTLEAVEEQVDAWIAKTEPFDVPEEGPAGTGSVLVDRATGEVLTTVSPDQQVLT
jgi:hypothetical protein